MNVDQRQRIEQEIARAAATGLIEAGYSISVFDSEEIVLKRSTNVERIVEAMFSTDEDYFYAYRPEETERAGYVHFVYGNEGWNVISDNSLSLEPALEAATALSESYAWPSMAHLVLASGLFLIHTPYE